METKPRQHGDDEGATSPPEGTPAEATTPPGNPAADEDAVKRAREELEKAGGGH